MATDEPLLRQQVVRDLHWVMAAPHLLQEGSFLPLWPDGRSQALAVASRSWLLELDADPAPLHAWLLAQVDFHRIGHYFAALVEFWLRQCPALSAQKVLARQHVPGKMFAPKGPPRAQEEERVEREDEAPTAEPPCRDQLKFLACLADEVIHLEAGFHFSLAKGPREVDVVASRFSGGFLHESLCWRILEARVRTRAAKDEAVSKLLVDWLGSHPSSYFLLRGCIFYPASLVLAGREEAALRPPDQEPSLLSQRQPVGWWTWDVAELLAAPGADSSRWAPLLYKRYWLSPVVCVEQPDGRVCTEGDPKIKLKSIEALQGDEFAKAISESRHLKARNPVLVSELQRSPTGRWEEVSKGLVLPAKWSMDFPQDDGGDLKAEASITRLQCSMEQVLQREGLDAWWRQVDKLETLAVDTEKRSAQAQDQRAATLWCPPAAVRALEGDLAHALTARWAQCATEEELCDAKAALISRLADAPSLTEEVILGLLELRNGRQHRGLGHVLLDGAKRLAARRPEPKDRPLTEPAQVAWRQLVASAGAGGFCPKVLAKASKQLALDMPGCRSQALEDLLARFRSFGFPEAAVPSTEREATLTGAAQLCALRLQRLKRNRRHRNGPPEEQLGCCLEHGCLQKTRCCLARCGCEARCCCSCACRLELREDEVRPLLSWCGRFGELAAAKALCRPELCGDTSDKLASQLPQLLEDHGVSLGRRQRRKLDAEADTPSTAASSAPAPKLAPKVALELAVEHCWVDTAAALEAATEEILRRAALEGYVVALDAEWKPFASGEAPTPVELLQLAVPSGCWLLDLPALKAAGRTAGELLRQICQSCVLLGFGLAGDLARLKDAPEPAKSIDLQEDSRSCPAGGLGELVSCSLGRALCKDQQCSDWSARPLSPEQVRYAALDAHVLLSLLGVDLGASQEEALHPEVLAGVLHRASARSWQRAKPRLLPLGPEAVDEALRKLKLPICEVTPDSTEAIHCKTLALVGLGDEEDRSRRAVAVLTAACALRVRGGRHGTVWTARHMPAASGRDAAGEPGAAGGRRQPRSRPFGAAGGPAGSAGWTTRAFGGGPISRRARKREEGEGRKELCCVSGRSVKAWGGVARAMAAFGR
ncbi:unnamed protein product [Effrenium voratum]|uniref:3'-5' exonuclease domain-containing protein n=1 Tax=Effrenium voratum TaxID=2562239 RepID=A0AA36JT34_9DINO|nr:unnamed protein product [Effrenium voratum]